MKIFNKFLSGVYPVFFYTFVVSLLIEKNNNLIVSL